MSLEKNTISIEDDEEDIQSEASSALSKSVTGSEGSDGDIANPSDFDLSDDDENEKEVEKNPEEEYSEKSAAIDTSVSHPASFTQEKAKAKAKAKASKKSSKIAEEENNEEDDDDDDDKDEDEEDEEQEEYLQKFDKNFRNEFVNQYHPESNTHNYEEVKMRTIIRRSGETINDEGHRTLPFLTKYEKTRVLGQRAKQINAGAKPLIEVPGNVMDGYVIANLELEQKKIPFIIKRPLPNGECEYWNLADLELMD